MSYSPQKHQRRSIRLRDYDYSQAGAYFITICTHNKECIFGRVTKGEMVLNKYGKVVEEEWHRSEEIRHEIELDAFVVIVGVQGLAPLQHGHAHLQRRIRSLSTFITGFKSAATMRINELRGKPHKPVWQRNYYEHVIRNEHDLNEIREYIVNNALKWDSDSENPNNIGRPARRPYRSCRMFSC